MLKSFNGKDVSMLQEEQLQQMTKTPDRPLTLVFVPHAYLDIFKKVEEVELVEDEDVFAEPEPEPEAEPEAEAAVEVEADPVAAAVISGKAKKKKHQYETGNLLLDGTDVAFRVASFGAAIYEPLDKVKAIKAGVEHGDVYETAIVRASPPTANTELENAADCAGKWVLVDRGECRYAIKAINCQAAGAAGCIIVNSEDKLMVPSDHLDEAGPDVLTIPVILVAAGQIKDEAPSKICVMFERGTKPKSMRGQMLALKYSKVDMEVRTAMTHAGRGLLSWLGYEVKVFGRRQSPPRRATLPLQPSLALPSLAPCLPLSPLAAL